jgi:predicted nucleotidyltransferase
MKEELRRDLSEGIQPLPVKRAALFGSVARGDDRIESDVDVYFETPSMESSDKVIDLLAELQAKVWRKYGNAISPLILTSKEVRGSSRRGVLKSIEEQGIPLGP